MRTATHAQTGAIAARTTRRLVVTLVRLGLGAFFFLMLAGAARGAGPRWVASAPTWQNEGQPMGWYRNDVTYRVDGGALSTSVNNAAATAVVDAAAAVWNVAYSKLTLKNGGALQEDVSSANVYLGSSGPIWPADVASTNYTAVPIAVVFDADGTLIDMLLGGGASAPSSCRQNAAVENVDKFIQPGSIAHAIILLNGRCTGPAPEQQLQLQYQLMRVFGRVLGLAWSQVNDNVFTGAPAPTYQQQLHWPIMHPVDIVCGQYTYQCLPQPFTLRDDDNCAMRLLYGVSAYVSTNGKYLGGHVTFPTGEGMDGVNMVAVRQSTLGIYGTEPWETASSVSGYLFHGSTGNPVTGALSTFPALQGTWYPPTQGSWQIAGIPVIANVNWENVFVNMQAVNPLYVGQYAVTPAGSGSILPSGTPLTAYFTVVDRVGVQGVDTTVTTAAGTCTPGNDGTETSPVAVIAGGEWSGQLCGYGHTSWGSFAAAAGHSATLEVAALDENGAHTTGKLHPLLGLWHGTDAAGTLPTIASAATAFNARESGTTQLTASFSTTEPVRFAIADERGNGRPDFAYTARLLYAASVLPVRLPASGGAIRILGTGFQLGNAVTVGGVLATVTSITATEIDATAPTQSAIGGANSADLTVTDLRTGGVTTIAAGVVYASAAGDVLVAVESPSGSVGAGTPSTFSVRLLDANNQPVRSGTVQFSATAGSVTWSTCALASCAVTTDANGLASEQVAASAAGSVALRASTASGASVTASFLATVSSQAIAGLREPQYVAATAGAVFHPAVVLTANGQRAAATPVTWTVLSGHVALSATASTTAADGTGSLAATGTLSGAEHATLRACAWTNVCTTLDVLGVADTNFALQAVSGDQQAVGVGTSLVPVVLRVVDGSGNAVAGATVNVYQTATAWQPPCPQTGRCSVAPVYGTTSSSAVSDDDGLFSITPLQYSGAATVTRIVAAAGPSGYMALTLTRQP